MNPIQRLLLPLALLAVAFTSAASASLIKCAASAGCDVKLWNPTTQAWGPVEHVPDGTIVDSAWAIGWGEGWRPVP